MFEDSSHFSSEEPLKNVISSRNLIDEEQKREPATKPNDHPISGLDYALTLLSRRRYSTKELEKRLQKRGIQDTGNIIQRLKEWKYLDDEDFARSFVATRSRLSPRGPYLLRFELKAKGIPESIIDQTLSELLSSEQDLALEVLRKKLPTLNRYPLKKRREKAFAFLQRRGFRQDTVYEALQKVFPF
ncbi:regulatory protein RecX [Candidatus Peregrinibacteria bacterium]|nr:regulatory protein RecX [Candidatus Peregrinibacteria bacterium]